MYSVTRRWHYGDQSKEDDTTYGPYTWADEGDINVSTGYNKYLGSDGEPVDDIFDAEYVFDRAVCEGKRLDYHETMAKNDAHSWMTCFIETMPAKDLYVDFYYVAYDPSVTIVIPAVGCSKTELMNWCESYSFISFVEAPSTTTNPAGTFIVSYSGETIEPGSIIHINDPDNTITVTYYVSSPVYISKDEFVGLAMEDFISSVVRLGLVAKHDVNRDGFSDTVEKGAIILHGYGSYLIGETISYGLSLGSDQQEEIRVTNGQYVGKTEEEFQSIGSQLGLVPIHKSNRDMYSSDVEKGNIVWHGYGIYYEGENFYYGLSLGPGQDPASIVVSKDQFVGLSLINFVESATSLGLTPTHLPGRDAYSSTIEEGRIVTHGYGAYVPNENLNYGLSLGPESEATAIIMRPQYYPSSDTFEGTKSALQNLLAGFTNVEYIGVTSFQEVGQIEKIEVDGDSSYTAGPYPVSTPIKVSIVSVHSD
jgi:hypothetical protein